MSSKHFATFLLGFLAACFAAFANPVRAQTTLTADWSILGKSNLQGINSGETLNLGPNQIAITTNVVTNGNGNDANFVPYYSSGMLAYYTGQVGGQTGGLFYSVDHSAFDVGDYFESTFTLTTAVTNLSFTVANVDRYLGIVNFHDGVVIQYDTGNGNWQNLRSLTSAYTLGSAVGTTTLGGVQGFHGTNYAGSITSTSGNIAVNFGTVTVKRVRIRYMFGQSSPSADPSGNYQYIGLSNFTWQQSGVTVADLSLQKSVSNSSPTFGSTISYTLSLRNAGSAAASNVVVRDALPAGFTFVSASGYGTYDSVTGDWAVASISNGQTRQIVLTGTVAATPGAVVTNSAEVYSSAVYDPDSTPGNGNMSEDDYAAVSFTVGGTRSAGTAPTLVCPKGFLSFDWSGRAWTPGSTANAYQLGNMAFAWSISSPVGFMNIAELGGQHPVLTNAAQNQTTLSKAIDFTNRSQVALTTISLGEVVDGAQFTIFDVDYAANDFADRIKVWGKRNGGADVIPVLTNGLSNYVIGNEAFGDQPSDTNSANGNVTATFNQPIDTIYIEYGNHSMAPADPDGQAIQMKGGITVCDPSTSLTVVKSSTPISDPVNLTTNPKNVPGATVRYCILMTNTGSAAARAVSASDTLPTTVSFVSGSIRSGTDCSAATVEDDDAVGPDESDPAGASYSAGVLNYSRAEVLGGTTAAFTFEAIIN